MIEACACAPHSFRFQTFSKAVGHNCGWVQVISLRGKGAGGVAIEGVEHMNDSVVAAAGTDAGITVAARAAAADLYLIQCYALQPNK